ncbi:hypothetical protein RAH41_14175 [Gottfriedia acidiceleris]|uniref:hypothetical protein n=1 Tax=Gottfriedia acidiceleris TaxID=371036 RepID=UPI002F2660A3
MGSNKVAKGKVGFILLEIVVALIAIFAFVFSEHKTEVITQVTNISIMFIFPILAVLVTVVSFVQSSQTKKEIKPSIVYFIAYDCMAVAVANILATVLAYSSEEWLLYIGFGLQLIIFLISTYLIKSRFLDIYLKFNK